MCICIFVWSQHREDAKIKTTKISSGGDSGLHQRKFPAIRYVCGLCICVIYARLPFLKLKVFFISYSLITGTIAVEVPLSPTSIVTAVRDCNEMRPKGLSLAKIVTTA